MRVFLDTNVLVSAFATRGLCADLVRHLLVDHELLTGEVNLTELRRVLKTKLRVPKATVDSIEELIDDMVETMRAAKKAGAEQQGTVCGFGGCDRLHTPDALS